jgi:RNA polymerase sigma factor (sigma-70 family)
VRTQSRLNDLAQRCHDLLADVRNGRADAWEHLLDEFGALVLSVAYGAGLRGADAEDAYQATWMALHRSLPHIREPGALVAWISTTARRESWRLSKLRRTVADPEQVKEAAQHNGVETSPVDELQRLERRQAVQAGLASIDERCQELLERLFFASDSPRYEDVAAAMEMKVGSVGPTRIRCLAKLARWLQENGSL